MQYGVLLCGRFVFPLFVYPVDWLHRETFSSVCVLGQKTLKTEAMNLRTCKQLVQGCQNFHFTVNMYFLSVSNSTQALISAVIYERYY
jgi:hypothetical protein